MVEGPGATRNGRKVQRAVGRPVLRAEAPSLISMERGASLVGRSLAEAFTVGKELFLLFSPLPLQSTTSSQCGPPAKAGVSDRPADGGDGEVAVRLHFGMSGCLYVAAGGGRPRVPEWKRDGEASLAIVFGPGRPAGAEEPPPREAGGAEVVDLTEDGDGSGRGGCGQSGAPPRTLDDFFPSSGSFATGASGQGPPSGPSAKGGGGGRNKGRSTTPAGGRGGGGGGRRDGGSSLVTIEARGATVTGSLSANAARSKLSRLACRDSCSASFDARRVFEALRGAGTSSTSLVVSDAVLDQELFPGVGNIIKVEGLHRAGVDPRRFVASLSDLELRRVVLHCRRYSIDWLRFGRAPEKRVYNCTVCGTCNGPSVSMQKLGGGAINMGSGSGHAYMSRVTFWCRTCQPPFTEVQSGEGASLSQRLAENSTSPVSGMAGPPGAHQTARLMISCPEHGPSRTMLRRVRKVDSPNIARLFRLCRVKGCQFFAWADHHFPACSCNKKAVLRISKTERSGGRWFLSCPRGQGRGSGKGGRESSGCSLFEWARQDHLAPLGSALTPLL